MISKMRDFEYGLKTNIRYVTVAAWMSAVNPESKSIAREKGLLLQRNSPMLAATATSMGRRADTNSLGTVRGSIFIVAQQL